MNDMRRLINLVESAEQQLDEIDFKKAAATAGMIGALAGAPQDAQAGTDAAVDYNQPVISGHMDTDKTDADKVYNTNVRVIATSVTQAILKDSQGKPVKGGVSDKWEIKEFVPGTGMARVQIQYVLNGKQTAQVQINWHEYKINAVGYQAKLGDKQKPITGVNGLDIRTLKKGTNEQLEEGIIDTVKKTGMTLAIATSLLGTPIAKADTGIYSLLQELKSLDSQIFDIKYHQSGSHRTVLVYTTYDRERYEEPYNGARFCSLADMKASSLMNVIKKQGYSNQVDFLQIKDRNGAFIGGVSVKGSPCDRLR